MKKFLTLFISLSLALTLSFALIACADNGGTGGGGGGGGGGATPVEMLKTAINATLDADNYKESLKTEMLIGYYNEDGELLSEDDVFEMPQTGEINGKQFLQMIQELGEEDEPVNPSVQDSKETVLYYDFLSGKVRKDSVRKDENGQTIQSEYYEAEGTTVSNYYANTEEVYNATRYAGYADAQQAKHALKKGTTRGVDGISFAAMLDFTVKGTGENQSRTGTMLEMLDVLDYTEATNTYSAPLTVTIEGIEATMDFSLVVADGKLSEVSVDIDAYSMDMSGTTGLPVTMKAMQTIKIVYGDYGAVSVTIPADYKDAAEVVEYPVVGGADDWAEIFDGFDDSKVHSFTLRKSEIISPTEIHSTEYEVTVDTEKNEAFVKTTSEVSSPAGGSRVCEAKYYKVDGTNLKIYEGTFEQEDDYYRLVGWEEPTTEAITGDATEAIIAKLPQEIQDWYAHGLATKAEPTAQKTLTELYSEFNYTNFDEMEATLISGETELTVNIYFNYDWVDGEEGESGYKLGKSGLHIKYNTNKYMSVYAQDNGLSSYNPDNFID